MPIIYNPLGLTTGTFTSSFGGFFAPVTLYVENFTSNTESEIVTVPDTNGSIRSRIINKKDIGGTMTIAMNASASSYLEMGLTGSIPPMYASASAVTCMLSKTGRTVAAGPDYAKLNVDWFITNL